MAKLIRISLIVVLTFTVAIVLETAALAQSKPVKLSFNHMWAPTSSEHKFYRNWAKRIEEATNGRVKITLYPASTIVNPREAWQGLVAGVVDMGSGFSHYSKSGFEFNKAQLFFWTGAPDIEFAMSLMEKMRKKYPVLLEEYKDAKLLWTSAHGPRYLLSSKKPVRSISDLKGMLIRTPTPAEAKLVESLGAITPSFLPMSQVYSALQKGVFDGLWCPKSLLKVFRLGEVTKYVIGATLEPGHGKYVAMNKNVWNNLPKDIQAVFEKESAWAQKEFIKVWTQEDKLGETFAKSKGVEFIELPRQDLVKFRSSITQIQDDIAKKMDAKGYPGSALLNDIREAIRNAPENN